MPQIGLGILLWLILAVLGGVLVCLHSVVYHLLRCHAAQCQGLADFSRLAEAVVDTLGRINAGLVQVHERYLVLHKEATAAAARPAKLPWGETTCANCRSPDRLGRVASELSGCLSPFAEVLLTSEQRQKIEQALKLTKEVLQQGPTGVLGVVRSGEHAAASPTL